VHGTAPDATAETYTCKECQEKHYTADSLPDDLKLYKVEWCEAPEAISTIRNSATPQALRELDDLLASQYAESGTEPKKQRTTTQPRPRVTPSEAERVYDVTIGQNIRKKLVLHTLPINPHADIAPHVHGAGGGGCRMFLRPVKYATATGQIRSKELCCICGTDGRCEHMINPEAVARLQDAFTYMKNNHPDTMEALQAGTFEEELRRLALRHRQLPGTKATRAQHWSLPQKLKHAIMSQTKITQERFSNPFTVHPCSSSYWTAHD
jgi:hypothetical protein